MPNPSTADALLKIQEESAFELTRDELLEKSGYSSFFELWRALLDDFDWDFQSTEISFNLKLRRLCLLLLLL